MKIKHYTPLCHEYDSPHFITQDKRKVTLEIVRRFSIVCLSWECDSVGWIVKDTGENLHLVLTNHGAPYIASRAELEEKCLEYQDWVEETQEVLRQLK